MRRITLTGTRRHVCDVTIEAPGIGRLRDCCSDRHHCVAVAVLVDERRPLTLNDLTKAVVKQSDGPAITDADGADVAHVEQDLEAELVPDLTTVGFVEYDEERQLLRPGPRFDELRPRVAEIVDDHPDVDAPVGL